MRHILMKHNLCANSEPWFCFNSLSFFIRFPFNYCGMHKEASYATLQFLRYIQRMVYAQTYTYIMVLVFLKEIDL